MFCRWNSSFRRGDGQVEFDHRLCEPHFLMTEQATNLLRELPSVDRLLNHPRCEALLARYNREYFIQKCRDALDQSRAEIRQGKSIGGAQ